MKCKFYLYCLVICLANGLFKEQLTPVSYFRKFYVDDNFCDPITIKPNREELLLGINPTGW